MRRHASCCSTSAAASSTALFRDAFDVVSHQAARGNVRASMEDPWVYADVNVGGGINLLEAARRHGVRKIVYSSTGGCVYGELQYWPADERHPIRPRDPYGASKAAFELYLPVYQINYGLNYTILPVPERTASARPVRRSGVVSIFTGQMLLGKPTIINGDGEQSRDYVFVGDVVQANVLALEGGDNDVFNLGWGRGRPSTDLPRPQGADRLPGQEHHGPAKLGEVRRNDLDASKIERRSGGEPQVALEEGMRRTVEYFRPIITGEPPGVIVPCGARCCWRPAPAHACGR